LDRIAPFDDDCLSFTLKDFKTCWYSALPGSKNTCRGSSTGSSQLTGRLGVGAKAVSN